MIINDELMKMGWQRFYIPGECYWNENRAIVALPQILPMKCRTSFNSSLEVI